MTAACIKTAYPTRQRAETELYFIQLAPHTRKVPIRVYRCPHKPVHYHLTSKPERATRR